VKPDPTIDTAPVRQWFEILSSFGADRARLLQLLECDEAFLQERDNRRASESRRLLLTFMPPVPAVGVKPPLAN
jgi:hypothetical protein